MQSVVGSQWAETVSQTIPTTVSSVVSVGRPFRHPPPNPAAPIPDPKNWPVCLSVHDKHQQTLFLTLLSRCSTHLTPVPSECWYSDRTAASHQMADNIVEGAPHQRHSLCVNTDWVDQQIKMRCCVYRRALLRRRHSQCEWSDQWSAHFSRISFPW